MTLRGNWLVVQEFQGAEANRYPVSATPLRLLWTGARRASGHRNWNPSPKKAARLKSPCATRRAIPGRLVLIFDSETLALQGWRLLDIQQQRSTVWLHNVIRHERLPEDYFRIDESIAEAEDE